MNQNKGTRHRRIRHLLKFKPFLVILLILGIIFGLIFDLFSCLIFVFLSTYVYCITGLILTESDTFIIMCCIQCAIIAPIGVNFALLNVNFITIGVIVISVSEIITICYGLKKGI